MSTPRGMTNQALLVTHELGAVRVGDMRARGIREQVFGAMHPEVAQSLANLAVVYHASSNFKKARAYYSAAMKTYLAFKKPDAPELASLRANLEKLERAEK